jgi:hypothetical protein
MDPKFMIRHRSTHNPFDSDELFAYALSLHRVNSALLAALPCQRFTNTDAQISGVSPNHKHLNIYQVKLIQAMKLFKLP